MLLFIAGMFVGAIGAVVGISLCVMSSEDNDGRAD
jgi:hypothetical protein